MFRPIAKAVVASVAMVLALTNAPVATADAAPSYQRYAFTASPCSGSVELRGSLPTNDPTTVAGRITAILSLACPSGDPGLWTSGQIYLAMTPYHLPVPAAVIFNNCTGGNNYGEVSFVVSCSIDHPIPGVYTLEWYLSVLAPVAPNEPDCEQSRVRPSYKLCDGIVVGAVVGAPV